MKTKILKRLLLLLGILFALSVAWLGYELYDLFINDVNPFNFWPILPLAFFMIAYQVVGVAYDKSKFISKHKREDNVIITPLDYKGWGVPSNSQTPVRI